MIRKKLRMMTKASINLMNKIDKIIGFNDPKTIESLREEFFEIWKNQKTF